MNQTRFADIRNAIAAFLALFISASGLAAECFYFFVLGNPDGTVRTPVFEFVLPAIIIYLLFTCAGAVIVGLLWRGAPPWPSLIAACPYLILMTTGHGFGWSAIALFTFGVHYFAIRLLSTNPEANVSR